MNIYLDSQKVRSSIRKGLERFSWLHLTSEKGRKTTTNADVIVLKTSSEGQYEDLSRSLYNCKLLTSLLRVFISDTVDFFHTVLNCSEVGYLVHLMHFLFTSLPSICFSLSLRRERERLETEMKPPSTANLKRIKRNDKRTLPNWI